MGCYAGNTDSYLSQSDQTKVADAVKKYRLWSLSKEGDPGRTPALDLNFAENKSLVDDISGSNLITFTRSSAATYVGADGLIKTAGLNLFTNSNPWTGGSNVSWVSGFTSPFRGSSAYKMVENTSNDIHGISIHTGGYTADYNVTFSVFAKAAGNRYLSFWAQLGTYPGIDAPELIFDLEQGSVVGVENLAAAMFTNGSGSQIESYGDGWYRCSVHVNPTSLANRTFYLLMSNDGTLASGRSYTGNGSNGILLFGLQRESGDTATVYADTTSSTSGAPRFDHDPDTGESLGLLIEEARTNLVETSIPSGYSSFGRATQTTGITAPDGSTDAINYNNTGDPSGGGVDYIFTNFNTSFTTGTQYVISIFSTYSGMDITQGGLAAGNWTALNSTQHITYPNGWYRHWKLYEAAVDNPNITPQIVISTSATAQSNQSLWGLQVEQGSFPTSYIPTSGSTVTRSVDSALLDTSNWWDYTKGTAYAEYRGGLESQQSGYGRVWSPSGAATFIGSNAAQTYNNRHVVWFGGSTVQVAGQEHLISFAKNAMTYSNNGTNCDIVNASYPASATGTTNSSVDSASHGIGRNVYATVNMLNGHIKRMTYWEQVLDPSTLQSITQ